MKKTKEVIAFLTLALFTAFFSFTCISASASDSLQPKAESEISIKMLDETKYIEGFPENKNVSDLLYEFENASEIKVSKNDVILRTNDIVSTGTVLSCGDDKAIVVIKGDTNGDGQTNSTDYLQIKGFFLEMYHLEREYFLAADSDDDGIINSTDYLRIKGYFLGTYELYPSECEHDFGEWVVTISPSCTEDGERVQICSKCSVKNTEVIASTGHTEVIDEAIAPTLESSGVTEGKHCSVCDTVIIAQDTIPALPNVVFSETLNVDGENISGDVSNSAEVFNFIDNIHVENDLPWTLSLDVDGINQIDTKIFPLNLGENVFYIHVTHLEKYVVTYTVNIYRKHMYTVSFDSAGGISVETQYVEEGDFALEPVVSREGYTFNGWDFDFKNPISENIATTASWTANTDTPYRVEYYLQNLDKTDYELVETENLAGVTDTDATAEEKAFNHFTFDADKSTLSGNIEGDGTLVLKVYYTRNTYSVTVTETAGGEFIGGGEFSYGSKVTAKINITNLGYYFGGWYSGEELLSSDTEYTFTIDRDVVAKVEVVDEMKMFNFTSTSTTCTITGLKDKSVSDIVVPNIVTSINSNAFSGCATIKSVIIGEGVDSIGAGAFSRCIGLESITLPFVGGKKEGTSNTHFGYIFGASSYSNNNSFVPASLKTVVITAESEIPEYAFYECSGITSITIPNSVTSIGVCAFNACSGLESVSIPDGVISIGYSAFGRCSALKNISIPDSVTDLDGSAFIECPNLVMNEYGNAYYLGNSTNPYIALIKAKSTSTVNIFMNTKFIQAKAFYECTNLKSITVPNSVISIGRYAFSGCTGLVSATIGTSVTSIGTHMFENCTKLESLTLPFIGSLKDDGRYTYFGYLFGASSYNENSSCVPASLKTVVITCATKIHDYAFYDCAGIKSITLPDGLTYIGNYAFKGCVGISTITIPVSVTFIGKYSIRSSGVKTVIYNGTRAQWNEVSKGTLWDPYGSYTLQCTDVTIIK